MSGSSPEPEPPAPTPGPDAQIASETADEPGFADDGVREGHPDHRTYVLKGDAARAFLSEYDEVLEEENTCVATCDCGWREQHIHGEAAEIAAAVHGAP